MSVKFNKYLLNLNLERSSKETVSLWEPKITSLMDLGALKATSSIQEKHNGTTMSNAIFGKGDTLGL